MKINNKIFFCAPSFLEYNKIELYHKIGIEVSQTTVKKIQTCWLALPDEVIITLTSHINEATRAFIQLIL